MRLILDSWIGSRHGAVDRGFAVGRNVNAVIHEIVEIARALTHARYGVIATNDEPCEEGDGLFLSVYFSPAAVQAGAGIS